MAPLTLTSERRMCALLLPLLGVHRHAEHLGYGVTVHVPVADGDHFRVAEELLFVLAGLEAHGDPELGVRSEPEPLGLALRPVAEPLL